MITLTGLTFAQYDAMEGVNWSTLKSMRVSPLQYRHDLGARRPATDAMRLGIAAHCAVFEPDQMLRRFAIWDGERRYGREWDAFCAANDGRTILRSADYDKCLAIRDAVRGHKLAGRYCTGGQAELSIRWRDVDSDLECKARLDYVIPGRCVVDLKTTADIEIGKFSALSARLRYHTQLSFYTNGYALVTGDLLPAFIIAVQSDQPHDVAVYQLPNETLAAGEAEWMTLLDRLRQCRASNTWPGMYEAEQALLLPPWELARSDADAELLIGGEEVRL